jgi:ferredoxin
MRWTPAVLISVLLVCASMAAIPLNAPTLEAKNNVNHAVENNETTDLAFGWVTSAGGAGDDFISQSTIYTNGTFLIAGSYEGDIQFRDQIDGYGARGGSTDRDAFLGWVNPNGTWNASIAFGSPGIDSIEAVALLSNGDAILAGTYCLNTVGFQCELALDGVNSLTKNDEDDDGNVFLARLNGDGTWAWATQIGNEYDNFVFDMMITPTDEIHVGVLYRDTMDFNGEVLPAGTQTTMMVAVFGEGGNPLTHVVLETQDGIEPVGGLCLDGAGQAYLAATFNGEVLAGETLLTSHGQTDLMVASYQASEWAWAISGGSVNEDRAWDCSGSPTQGISVVGEFIGNATFGEFFTDTSNSTDLILGSVSSSGAWSGIATAGGPGVDRATDVITNGIGDIVIAGTTSAGLNIGIDQLDDLDGVDDGTHNDIFLASYLDNDSWAWAVSAGGDGNDEPTDLTFAIDGSPLLSFMLSSTANIGVHSATSSGGYDVGVWLYQTDRDSDGILDGEDNCPRVTNTAQGNHDGDLFGDDCDDDDDNDGVVDALDDCPTGEMNWASDTSTDHDSDGCQDSGEDFDDDEDTVFDFADLCPLGPVGWISTPEEDSEGDGCADYDTDEDGFIDQMDNCPSEANPTQSDLDGDGLGDACDVDEDGDGIALPEDNCPRDAEPWTSTTSNDYDQDGCQDATNDDDDDNDGYNDAVDACPTGAINWNLEGMNSEFDHDQDGCQDAGEDIDDDNDGYQDPVDACPLGLVGVALPGQDADADGCIDGAEDDDDDNDGVVDDVDVCPQTPALAQVGVQGCSMSQLDDDLDGVSNADDMCLNSLPGRMVDATGCAIINQTNDQSSSSDETNMTMWLFILAGVLLVAAGAVTLSGSQRKADTKEMPPKRPVGLDDAMNTVQAHEAE